MAFYVLSTKTMAIEGSCPSEAEAKESARKCARDMPGVDFVVLRVVSSFCAGVVETTHEPAMGLRVDDSGDAA